MTQQSPLAAPDRIRECDCPGTTVRCAHLPTGQVLSLIDWELDPPYWCRYHVCTNHNDADDDCPGHVITSDDHDAALASFHQAEQAFLRGDA